MARGRVAVKLIEPFGTLAPEVARDIAAITAGRTILIVEVAARAPVTADEGAVVTVIPTAVVDAGVGSGRAVIVTFIASTGRQGQCASSGGCDQKGISHGSLHLPASLLVERECKA